MRYFVGTCQEGFIIYHLSSGYACVWALDSRIPWDNAQFIWFILKDSLIFKERILCKDDFVIQL